MLASGFGGSIHTVLSLGSAYLAARTFRRYKRIQTPRCIQIAKTALLHIFSTLPNCAVSTVPLAVLTLPIYLIAAAPDPIPSDSNEKYRVIDRGHPQSQDVKTILTKNGNARDHDKITLIDGNTTVPCINKTHESYNEPAFAVYWFSDYYKQTSDFPHFSNTTAGANDWPELKGHYAIGVRI